MQMYSFHQGERVRGIPSSWIPVCTGMTWCKSLLPGVRSSFCGRMTPTLVSLGGTKIYTVIAKHGVLKQSEKCYYGKRIASPSLREVSLWQEDSTQPAKVILLGLPNTVSWLT